MHRSQLGFAPLEVVVVGTVVLLLAAFAVPRFTSVENEARIAAITNLRSSIRDTSALAHAQWIASGKPRTISMEGQAITISNGYPDTATLPRALQDTAGFALTSTSAAVTYRKTGAPEPEQCAVIYSAATPRSPAMVSSPLIQGC